MHPRYGVCLYLQNQIQPITCSIQQMSCRAHLGTKQDFTTVYKLYLHPNYHALLADSLIVTYNIEVMQ